MASNAQRAAGFQDIAQHMTAQERMRLWTSVLEQSEDGIVICDAQQRILVVNAAFERITGFRAQEAIGQTPRILHSGRQDPAFYAHMWGAIEKSGRWSGEIWNRRKSGELYVQWLTTKAICDQHGAATHYLGIFSDITERKAAQARARRFAEHDPLTKLPNRTLLMRRLQQLLGIAQNSREKVAVLFIDLDRFNEINDSMGHEAGDLLLQEVARRISSTVRHSDIVARMSADEFVVLLPGLLEADNAADIAQKMLDAIASPMTLAGQELAVSASMGICVYPEDGAEPEILLRNAIAAMQWAKRERRGAYRFYTRAMNERVAERLRMENALRVALERQELVLHYQPQVDLNTGTITGAEALVRWNRPGVGLVPPGEFIPLAQESGLIFAMGRWVIGETLRQIQAWDAAGLPPITVAINVSADEFHQPGFAENLAGEIRRRAIEPARLELELTESIAVKDVQATARTLAQLHRLGVRLSLDDFGTGYSSLSYLGRFPIDKIKIDQSFIRDMPDKPEAVQIVRAVIALARSFKMKVIAEGVETSEQLRALRNEGCDEIQGYFASPGLPPEAFSRFLREWRP